MQNDELRQEVEGETKKEKRGEIKKEKETKEGALSFFLSLVSSLVSFLSLRFFLPVLPLLSHSLQGKLFFFSSTFLSIPHRTLEKQVTAPLKNKRDWK
jgi:hypothetical protein